MEGPVSWPQLVWIVGLIAAGTVAGWVAAAWLLSSTAKERHALRSVFEQRVATLLDDMKLIEDKFEARLRTIELQNAGTLVILNHVDEFKKEVRLQYQELAKQRAKDMENINRQLNAIHNDARMAKLVHEDA